MELGLAIYLYRGWLAHLNIIHVPSKASQVGSASLVTALGWVEVHGVRHIVDFSDQALDLNIYMSRSLNPD